MAPTMRAWQYVNGVTAKTLVGRLEDSIALHVAASAPDKSSLTKDQLLIRVISASLNPADYKMPESDWFGRLFGLRADAQPGMDFCGRIVAKHDALNNTNSRYREGQRVFGSLAKASRFGTLGEFIVASTSEIAPAPEQIGSDQVAALGTSAGIAYKSLLLAGVKEGSSVFINGGSGGVGTYMIQLAKVLGATNVTVTTSSSNINLVRNLGADDIIDYKMADVLAELGRKGQIFDAVFDNVGIPQNLYQESHAFLKKSGVYVQVAADPTVWATFRILGIMSKSLVSPTGRAFRFAVDKGNGADYEVIARWVAEGKVKPVIGRTVEFEENVPEAYAELRRGRSRGKIVVHVGGGVRSENGRERVNSG